MLFARKIRWMLIAGVGLLITCAKGEAGYIDFDPQTPGDQTASWPQPSTIMVFIPAGLAGDDRMNFEMGINALIECLPQIMVQFKDGEPPQNSQSFVDVNLVSMNAPPFGTTEPATMFGPGQNHGTIGSATMDIDPSALGKANLMKNLGAHEFGHVLGLDEHTRQGGMRMDVMDPDFNMNDPFISWSANDKMMLDDHYQVVPEPATIGLSSVLALALLARRRW